MDFTLDLALADSPHAAAVAGAVALGVAVALGLPPLAADRVSRAIASTCERAGCSLELVVRPGPGAGATIALTRAGGAWSEQAAAPLTALGAANTGASLLLTVSRTGLALV